MRDIIQRAIGGPRHIIAAAAGGLNGARRGGRSLNLIFYKRARGVLYFPQARSAAFQQAQRPPKAASGRQYW
jgi:hypothetical protein